MFLLCVNPEINPAQRTRAAIAGAGLIAGQNKNGDFLLSIKFPVLTLK